MQVRAIKTPRLSAGTTTLTGLIDATVPVMPPGSVLAITSKVVSLCENAVAPADAGKEDLIQADADYYLPGEHSKYGIRFTITRDTLIPSSGIDESNFGDGYVLWPRAPQRTANAVRSHLVNRSGHEQLGVVITDSTCRPLRRGVSGIAIAFSGFMPLRDYVGEPGPLRPAIQGVPVRPGRGPRRHCRSRDGRRDGIHPDGTPGRAEFH